MILPPDRVIHLTPPEEPTPRNYYWAAPISVLLAFIPLFF